jgi:predicted transcriptional regulator
MLCWVLKQISKIVMSCNLKKIKKVAKKKTYNRINNKNNFMVKEVENFEFFFYSNIKFMIVIYHIVIY